MESIVKMMQEKQKGVKERQLNRLLWGCLLSLGGLLPILLHLFGIIGLDEFILLIAAITLAIGIAFLAVFIVGQYTLRSEMEREDRENLQA